MLYGPHFPVFKSFIMQRPH